ncbi:hypothetical protein [Actinophytocola gossypii]|uniref:DUF2567 domain-containing protein n=1 Tax=Actinophytocola gossypii TaxID=2812003 RepID=A0ABT2JGB5_9PSEU|nr:hypothetical protein [Actinophytocola gossypii]MCT2586905.1 hypothetical protein [Actinophytocola gossypii]
MTTTSERVRPTAMYVGLGLTILATLVPVLDIATVDTLAGHVRDAYPDWGADDVRKDRDAIAIYLVGTGALGIVLWVLTIRAFTGGRRWARAAMTAACGAGLLVALTNLSLGGDHYDVVVPYGYGVLTLLPCLAGLVAVVSVWRPARRA